MGCFLTYKKINIRVRKIDKYLMMNEDILDDYKKSKDGDDEHKGRKKKNLIFEYFDKNKKWIHELRLRGLLEDFEDVYYEVKAFDDKDEGMRFLESYFDEKKIVLKKKKSRIIDLD